MIMNWREFKLILLLKLESYFLIHYPLLKSLKVLYDEVFRLKLYFKLFKAYFRHRHTNSISKVRRLLIHLLKC